MITRIVLKNIAIVEGLEQPLHQGLTVITGESGSGKSLILQAAALAFGEKVSPRQILKAGTEKGLIELTLCLSKKIDKTSLGTILADFSFEDQLDEPEWLLCREVSNHNSRFRLNGMVVPKDLVTRIRPFFIDIHGQQEWHQLFSSAHQLSYLDTFAASLNLPEPIELIKQSVRHAYEDWKKAQQDYERLQVEFNATQQSLEFLQFQVNELGGANITDPNEDEAIKQTLRELSSATQLQHLCQLAASILKESTNQETPTVPEQLGVLIKKIKVLKHQTGQMPLVEEIASKLDQMVCELEETTGLFETLSDRAVADPEQLRVLTDRLDCLNHLKRKYGPSLEAVIQTHESLSEKLAFIENSESHLAAAKKNLDVCALQLKNHCQQLSLLRKQTATLLKQNMEQQLKQLAMPGILFRIAFDEAPFSAQGEDAISFLFSANPGESLKPLEKVASGGELSRFLFAMKVLQNQHQTAPMTLIFDEIDTGISGQTLLTLAQQIAQLAQHNQVLVITHQPLVAALGETHLHVNKEVNATGVRVYIHDITTHSEKRRLTLASLIDGKSTSDQTTLSFIGQLQTQAGLLWQNVDQNQQASQRFTARAKK
ncbi:MAG: hypothetical protein AAGI66_08590 [Cyanobacteria bacterium P01_H01_bin.74]